MDERLPQFLHKPVQILWFDAQEFILVVSTIFVAVIVGGKTTKVAGIFQQQAKATANAVAASRPDLTVAALAKLSAVQRGLRVAAAAAARRLRSCARHEASASSLES